MGDSHSRALLKGYKAWSGDTLPPMTIHPLGSGANFYAPFFEADAKEIRFTVPELTELLEREFRRDRIRHEDEVVWGFSMGFHSVRFFRADLWNQYAPIGFPDDGKHQYISDAVFRRIVEIELRHIFSFLEAVRGLGAKVFVVSAPPPPPHNPKFRNEESRAITIAVNRAFREQVRRLMLEKGIPFVLPPADVHDEEHLLLPHYAADHENDTHHANPAYAALMLPRIKALMAEQGWTETAFAVPVAA